MDVEVEDVDEVVGVKEEGVIVCEVEAPIVAVVVVTGAVAIGRSVWVLIYSIHLSQ